MSESYVLNSFIQHLSFQHFCHICHDYDICVKKEELKIILKLIKNNPYPAIHEEYQPILLYEIEKKTSKETCQSFLPFFKKHCLLLEVKNPTY